MRAPISVIIPTLNAADALPLCLAALGEGLQAGLIRELVVSDGGSSDATIKIAEAAGGVVVKGPASRGEQLQRGADAAQGEWLFFLHADTVLSEGWSGPVSHSLTKPGGYHAQLRFDATGFAPRFVAAWANFRSRRFGLPYGDQGLLIDRETYDGVGGFRAMPLMEDVEMARALRGKLAELPIQAVTSAKKYQNQGWIKRGSRNLITLARHLSGTDSETLAQAYRR
ncbi:TIGR04283 family arsenosugar biosynthesis glycosyltransferase [uncultured Pelagimonas sp.]|uniref:TIGR04283 family arsenosugar biosynthesis glycosyltransferase n=1 Tax=uncultured Pelagimonas sp. TaxID=1618102 RepID=UPI00260513F2|nr:TIGR04283 family arsenosugar biosynthesis glycosyltransferase [uncultured Pelagimonas sp.]